jgi:hypothetical protein
MKKVAAMGSDEQSTKENLDKFKRKLAHAKENNLNYFTDGQDVWTVMQAEGIVSLLQRRYDTFCRTKSTD